jgi:hypothetical protein
MQIAKRFKIHFLGKQALGVEEIGNRVAVVVLASLQPFAE